MAEDKKISELDIIAVVDDDDILPVTINPSTLPETRKVTVSGLFVGREFTPSPHAESHKTGESDSIKLDELDSPTDNTNLNASTSAHGLLLKLDNNTSHFLRGDGTWNTPAGGGGSDLSQIYALIA